VKPRERLLATATSLFCRHGVRLGLERIVADADVALMTVYRQFGGKDGLVAAALAHWSAWWLRRVEAGLDRVDGGPASPLDDLWDVLEDWTADPDFTGSLIADAARELRGAPAHPAHEIIAAHREAFRRLLSERAVLAGARDPEAAAGCLEVLVDGFVAAATTGRGPAAGVSVRALGDAVLQVRAKGGSSPRAGGVVSFRKGRTRRRVPRQETPATPAG
jgi:AcrR family transcriptional regulator